MHSRTNSTTQPKSLASIMNSWKGQEVTLRVQGNRISVIQHKPNDNNHRKNDKQMNGQASGRGIGFGLFSRLNRANAQQRDYSGNGSPNLQHNRRQSENLHCPNPNINKLTHNQSQKQFVLRADKLPAQRVSLADLGQIYNNTSTNSRGKGSKNRKMNLGSVGYPNLNQTYNTNTNKYNNYPYQQNENSGNHLQNGYKNKSNGYHNENGYNYSTNPNKQKYQTVAKYSTNPSYQVSGNQDYNYSHNNPHYKPTNKTNKGFYGPQQKQVQRQFYDQKITEKESEHIQKIKQSINQIKLPNNQHQCPQYAKANQRFEKMKGEILQKIISSGEISQMDQILRQIRQAADNIIAKHSPSPSSVPKLKKNQIFSFKQSVQNKFNPKTSTQRQKEKEQNIKQIGQLVQYIYEDKSQLINLPQFKDEAGSGSISSILSLNGQNKKDESKDEDLCKIQNILIVDGISGSDASNAALNIDNSSSGFKNMVKNIANGINVTQNYIDNSNNNTNQFANINNSNSIRPIVLQQLSLNNKESEKYEQKIIEEVKIQQSIAGVPALDEGIGVSMGHAGPEMSMRVTNTIAQSNGFNPNIYGNIDRNNANLYPYQQIKKQPRLSNNKTSLNNYNNIAYNQTNAIPSSNYTSGTEGKNVYGNANVFKKKQQQFYNTQATNNNMANNHYSNWNHGDSENNSYKLEKLTNQPVKIITNLQQAQKFDPQVVKFTQLKAKFLQTRVTTPQIIRIPSPLKFVRKEEVVKCLVARHVVDKQSASIQF